MNMKTDIKKQGTVSAVEARAELDGRIYKLNQLHSKLTGEIVSHQRSMVAPIALDPAPKIDQLAASYTKGEAPEIPATGNARERLALLLAHATAVERALGILNTECMHLYAPALAELMSQRGMSWNGIVRRRALALIELRKANAEARAFRRDLIRTLKGGGNVNLVCSFFEIPSPLFAIPVVGDHAFLFLTECVKAGICTQSEIAEAINHLQEA